MDPCKWFRTRVSNMPRIRSLLLCVVIFVGEFGWGEKGLIFLKEYARGSRIGWLNGLGLK